MTQATQLADFIAQMKALTAANLPEAELLPLVKQAMLPLLATTDWLPAEYAQPHPEYYRQYRLHAEDSFSIVSFVWGPGQSTPIHDHTIWGVIGMFKGSEISQNHSIDEQGRPQPQGEPVVLKPGDVEYVSPSLGDIHQVINAYDDQVSISIHVYGADIGKVSRHVFPLQGGVKEFVSGYSNT